MAATVALDIKELLEQYTGDALRDGGKCHTAHAALFRTFGKKFKRLFGKDDDDHRDGELPSLILKDVSAEAVQFQFLGRCCALRCATVYRDGQWRGCLTLIVQGAPGVETGEGRANLIYDASGTLFGAGGHAVGNLVEQPREALDFLLAHALGGLLATSDSVPLAPGG